MDYSFLIFLIILIIVPIIILFISSILFYIYDILTSSNKSVIKDRNLRSNIRKNLFFKQERRMTLNLIILIYLILAIFLTYIIADILYFNILNLKLNIILIIFCLIIPVFFSGINYKSQKIYFASKELFKITFDYFIPILLSILSLIILLLGFGLDLSELNLLDIKNFQLNSQLKMIDLIFPALFIIINPFAAIAFFSGVIGIIRTYRGDIYNSNKINQKIFSKFLRNVSSFALILLFIFLFIGGGYFYRDFIIANLIMFIIICIVSIILISLIDFDRPKLFIERRIWNFINIPMLFSIIALVYSILFLFFNNSLIFLVLN